MLAEILLLRDLVEQFSATAELGDEEIPLFVLEELVQFQNVGVVQLLQNVDFRNQARLIFLSQIFLVDNFYCSQGLGLFVEAFSDFPIGPSADAGGYLVEVFDIARVFSHEYRSTTSQGMFTLSTKVSVLTHLLGLLGIRKRRNSIGDLLVSGG